MILTTARDCKVLALLMSLCSCLGFFFIEILTVLNPLQKLLMDIQLYSLIGDRDNLRSWLSENRGGWQPPQIYRKN